MLPHFPSRDGVTKLVTVTAERDPAALIIGERLRLALEEGGISVRELARRLASDASQLETARRTITRWVAGDAKPNRENAAWLAQELKQPTGRFVVSKAEAANAWGALEARVDALEAQSRGEQPGPQEQRNGDT